MRGCGLENKGRRIVWGRVEKDNASAGRQSYVRLGYGRSRLSAVEMGKDI